MAGRGPSGLVDVSSGESRSGVVELLARLPLFASLTKRQLRTVAATCSEARFAPGQHLVKEREEGQLLVVIAAGKAEVVRDGKTIATVGTGDAIGEMSLLDGEPRSASVIAANEVDALLLYGTAFRKLLADHPEIAMRLLRAQTARLRALNKRASLYG
jgi:CRP/FNR family transcriptional regulator, cyclic AMP receptor protein